MTRIILVTYAFLRGRMFPMLRLRGRWLREAGFTQGRRVEVMVSRGRLTLQLLDDAERLSESAGPGLDAKRVGEPRAYGAPV